MRFWIGISCLVAAVLVAGCGACDEAARGDYYDEIPNGEKPNVDGTEEPSVPPVQSTAPPTTKQQNY